MARTKKAATKEDIEAQTAEFKKTLGVDTSAGADDIDIADQNVDHFKYALYAIIHGKGKPERTTNLDNSQIRALAKMKALNHFYGSKAVDEYYHNIIDLQMSETKDPHNILEGIGNLFKSPQIASGGIGSKISRFIRGGR